MTKINKLNIGIYISFEKINSINDGAFMLLSMIFSNPLPKLVIIKSCGRIPISVPKK